MSELNAATSSSPQRAVRARRILFWVSVGIFALVMGVLITLMRPSLDDALKAPLTPDNPAPAGAQAVAEVLKDHGISLDRTTSRTHAQSASAGSTLVVAATPTLSDTAFAALISEADVVVLISPTASQLELALSASRAGHSGATLAPACDAALVTDLSEVSIGSLYASERATACFPEGDGAGLLIQSSPGQTIYAIDGSAMLANEVVSEHDNAALALRLLSQRENVVWYVATPADSDLSDTDTSLGALTPGWVTPVMVLLTLVAGAAIFWRGRRFGPLVRERLPVTVKVSETLEGQAKLYARGRDLDHAARLLRGGATRTLAKKLGLGETASVDAVAAATARLLGMNPAEVAELLAGTPPTSDAALMTMSDRLTHLTAAIDAAYRSERTAE